VKRFLTAPAAAVAVLLLIGTSVHASQLPPQKISWTYNWSPAAPALKADGSGGAAGITFTNEPTRAATGSSDIVATNLRVFSAATADSPDKISGSNGNYTLSLTLTANVDGTPETRTLTFHGTLAGTFSSESANVTNQFTGTTSQAVTFGKDSTVRFTVQMIAYTPPGPPQQANAGSLAAHVTIENVQPNNVPEPSALVLSGMGLTFLGGAAVRRYRKAVRDAAAA
jgi:hypothetical protein